jgi:hypothetical protein
MRVAAAAGLIFCFAPGCKPPAKPAGPPKAMAPKNTNALSTTNVSSEYVSVFEQLMPPKGRDPFFPASHRRDPRSAQPSSGGRPLAASELLLKGIVGSANHRLAVINGSILEVGEEEAIGVSGGHLRVRCLEIGEDYAVVRVVGETEPKRLELKKKDF